MAAKHDGELGAGNGVLRRVMGFARSRIEGGAVAAVEDDAKDSLGVLLKRHGL